MTVHRGSLHVTLAAGLVAMAALLVCPTVAAPERVTTDLIEPPIDNTHAHITTTDVRDALDLMGTDVVSINFGTSAHAGFDVFGSATSFFPLAGSSFFVMSTGATASAVLPNSSPSTSTVLGGLNTSTGEDLVQVVLTLQPPSNASCLAFDFAFYSEEFPEFVGSPFNDAFIAEIGQSTFQIVGSQVIAPNNFAFDSASNVISVNTVFGVTAANASGTTYDGATTLLTARTPLENPGAQITVTLSIMDLGDSIYDSTAFIDNFRWLFGTACEPGAEADSDRDSLLDGWETSGIDFDNDGVVDLDLPAMGADPNHKDVFIECDYMVLGGATGHSHKPLAAALQTVVTAFQNAPVTNPDGTTGINLHIDAGSDTIMNPVTNATWGTRSQSNVLAHQNNLGATTATGSYDWTAFDGIKGAGTPGMFDVRRADVFHYCIFAHSLAPTLGTTSGISRGIPASDFIVSLGGWTGDVGSVNQQAGTLMHEFGHNFGLLHGGDDGAGNYEPNYLSIMNYFFQMRGLRIVGSDGNFDYSRFALSALDETDLDETVGLTGVAAAAGYGTRHYDGGGVERLVNDINGAIDWNRDGDGGTDTSIALDINGTGIGRGPGLCSVSGAACLVDAHCGATGGTCTLLTTLENTDNWNEIVFNGGAVGHLGEAIVLPMESESIDITEVIDSALITEFGVTVTGPGPMTINEGRSASLEYIVTNTGIMADTYMLSAMESQAWADMSDVPAMVMLDPGESAMFSIVVSVPRKTLFRTADEVRVDVTSGTRSLIMDSAETTTSVFGPVEVCHIPPDNPANAHTITINPNALPDHLAHGDTVGACAVANPVDDDFEEPFGLADRVHKHRIGDSPVEPGRMRVADSLRARQGRETTKTSDRTERLIIRHLRMFSHPGATGSARAESRSALLDALEQGHDPELRLKIVGALAAAEDESLAAHLTGHLAVIQAELRRSDEQALAAASEELLRRLQQTEN